MMNISSVIVSAAKDIARVTEEIEKLECCEVHLQDNVKGIIIVTIEAQEIAEEVKILEKINAIDGVIEANMHYSYSEDELEKAREEIAKGVSEVLDDSYPIESVRYSGSISTHLSKNAK